MTVLQSESFATGTNGNTVVLANTIFSSQLSSPTYVAGIEPSDTGHAALIKPSGTGTGHLDNTGFVNTGKSLMRMIIKFTELPSGDTIICRADDGDTATGVKGGDLILAVDGKLKIRNGSTLTATSTTVLAAGTAYALEWLVDPVANTQTLRIYTTLTKTASPVETISGTYNKVEQLTQYLIGKMTATTWTNGIIVDGYKRADDWWATSVADSWNEHFNERAVGLAFQTTPDVDVINQNAPKFFAGGPHTDQKVIGYAADDGAFDCRIRSVGFGSGVVDGYQRFYFKVESEVVWLQRLWCCRGATATAVSICLNAGSDATHFTLEAWRGDDFNLPVDETNQPLSSSSELKVGVWHRIDVRAWDDGAGVNIDARYFAGASKNLPIGSETGNLTGFSDVGGMRYGWLGPDLPPAAVLNTIVYYDEWRGSTVTWVGPLDPSEQFDAPVGVTWAAFEYDGAGGETPLTPYLWDGTALQPLDISATTVVGDGTNPPPDGLFTADPGMGSKMYWGLDAIDNVSGDRYDVIANFAHNTMQSLSAGTAWPASDRVHPGCYRGFYSGFAPSMPIGKHSDTTWTLHRKVMANTAISSWSLDVHTAAIAADIFGGVYDNFLTNTLAPLLTEAYERYGHLTLIDLGNEADRGDAYNQGGSPLWIHRIRRAVRYMHFFLTDQCGVDPNAFGMSMVNIVQATNYETPTRHTKTIDISSNYWPGGDSNTMGTRGDPVYFYSPDWKETRTTTGGFWGDAFTPNGADFTQAGELDIFGYGRGPIHKLWSHNAYERDYEYGLANTGGWASVAEFEARVLSVTGGYPRDGNLYKFNKALWGGANPVLPVPWANAKGIGTLLGEWGIGIYVPDPSSTNDSDPAQTAKSYRDVIWKDAVQNCNIVAVNHWRYVPNAYGSGIDKPPDVDTFSLHYKVGDAVNAGSSLYDNANGNTKAFAAMFTTDLIADPPPWPDGTPRPPNAAAGSKADYRGFGDVP